MTARSTASSTKRVLLVGSPHSANLETSYERAFRNLGCEVVVFDVHDSVTRNSRFGRLGRTLGNFVAVEPWILKANREMFVRALGFQPDLLVVVGAHPVRVGALAQIKVACPDTSLALVWPDPLLNFGDPLKACLPIFDVVATYNNATAPVLEALGANHAFWLPLGADEELHGSTALEHASERNYEYDVSFIGDWRPEREAALLKLTDFDLKIWGPAWDRRCKDNSFVLKAWQGKALRGNDYAEAIRASKVNLNIIDPTCYPAANMRTFEIPIAGGLQLSSACPEMDSELRDGEHLFYYENVDALPGLVGSLLADDERRFRVADAGRALVSEKHTYIRRAETLLRECDSLESRTTPETRLSSASLNP